MVEVLADVIKMKSSALIFFALFVFTVITSVNSVVPFIEDEDEGTARKTVPEKRGYTWSCYRIVSIQRFSKNLTCLVRFKENRQVLDLKQRRSRT